MRGGVNGSLAVRAGVGFLSAGARVRRFAVVSGRADVRNGVFASAPASAPVCVFAAAWRVLDTDGGGSFRGAAGCSTMFISSALDFSSVIVVP